MLGSFVLGLTAVVFMAGFSFNEMQSGEKSGATPAERLYSFVSSPDEAYAQTTCTTCNVTLADLVHQCIWTDCKQMYPDYPEWGACVTGCTSVRSRINNNCAGKIIN